MKDNRCRQDAVDNGKMWDEHDDCNQEQQEQLVQVVGDEDICTLVDT